MAYKSNNDKTTDDTLVLKDSAVLHKIKSYNENEDLLDKLLKIGMKQCEDDLLIPHAEVMIEIKRRYNIA